MKATLISENGACEYAERIINTVREPLIALDHNLRVVTANRSFYDVFKVKPEETVGALIYDLGNKQWDIPKLRDLLGTILPEKTTFDNYAVEHDFADIGRRTMLLNARQIEPGVGKEQIILLAIEDITERVKKAAKIQKTLKKLAAIVISEDKAREYAESIINTVREPLIVLDHNLRVVTANRSFYDVFKVKPEETVGVLIYDLGNKQWDIPKLRDLLETILPEKAPFDNYEVEHDFADIGRRIMLLNARQIEPGMGKERIILLAIEDITESKRLEKLLTDSEMQYRRIFETATDGILLLEKREGKIINTNQAAEKMFGYSKEECIGKKLQDVGISIDMSDFHAVMSALDKNSIINYDNVPVKNRFGQNIFTDIYLVDRASLAQCNIRDITDRKKLEAMLQQSQKMEAIGTLAGGIAHDFNNILMAILGYTELAISNLPQGSATKGNLEEVLNASIRAIELVKQILTFSRRSEKTLFPIAIHLIVKEAAKLLRSSLPTTIKMKQNITARGKVLADLTQIHQIIMNLCTNASYAMSEKGGELSISLISVNIPNYKSEPMDLPPGPYLKLTVGDTGFGMTSDVRNRIFEPYFTTKGKDEGTGLGLSVVHGIVQNHGGFITVESTPGKGSAFHVYLPEIIAPDKDIESIQAAEADFTGAERILFVDDEPTLVKLGKTILESLGYIVIGKTSSEKALELFKANPEQFDLVITDMTMPNLTGAQLSEQLLEIRPDIPIILCSGFSEKMTEKTAKEIGIREFLLKPIPRQVLSKIIRKVLDEYS